MSKDIKEYYATLKTLFDKIIVTGRDGKVFQLDKAIDSAINIILSHSQSGKKIFFIGNGASASIASHMAVDFWKNGGIRAHAFNDAALLTCISNDYGYRRVFQKPIEIFVDSGDILFAISSSGQSENIIRAVQAARLQGCYIITLSGFNKDNPLRSLGELNFYIPYSSYGFVEVIHQSICHCILDNIGRK
jgi:D-sedoheptulose 7-phosphate isomerase